MSKPTCSTPECEEPSRARGRCQRCYTRYRRSPEYQLLQRDLHSLTDIDPDTRRAVCSICGPSKICRNGPDAYVCSGLVKVLNKKYKQNGGSRRYRMRAIYNISEGEYNSLYAAQGGCCAICRKPCTKNKNLSIDHDHRTGRIRGLLCSNCNLGIGKLGDTLESILAVAEYLGAEITIA